MDSTPLELECYVEAEKMIQKRKDAERWQMGMYNMSAVSVAVSRALAGKKSKAKYIEKPMSEQVSESQKEEENLTEEQAGTERDKLLAALMTMQANFELNHGGGD